MQAPASRPAPPLRLLAAWGDAALLGALPAGHEGAFAETYRRYGLGLLEQASRKTGSHEAAEEIVQDVFTTLWLRRAPAATVWQRIANHTTADATPQRRETGSGGWASWRWQPGYAGAGGHAALPAHRHGRPANSMSHGEAFFEVCHDARHPFSVLTDQVVSTVLGTSCRVRAVAGQPNVRVEVRTGAVRVSPRTNAAGAPAAASMVVRPNQQAVYSPTHRQRWRELVARPVQRRAREARDTFLQGAETVVERQLRVLAKGQGSGLFQRA